MNTPAKKSRTNIITFPTRFDVELGYINRVRQEEITTIKQLEHPKVISIGTGFMCMFVGGRRRA